MDWVILKKRNLARVGFDWLRVIERIVQAPYRFMKRYFKRNLSEAGFSADKRRFGWLISRGEKIGGRWLCLLSGCCTTYLQ